MENEESFYHFSTEDFGSEVYCVVSSKEFGNKKPKKECLKFGPFELSPLVRQEVESNLVSGSCMYSGFIRVNPKSDLKNLEKNGPEKEGQIRERKEANGSGRARNMGLI